MSYTVNVYWKNCPKWDPTETPNFMQHLMLNVSVDTDITVYHLTQLSEIPVTSITQNPSSDPAISWVTVIECADEIVLNSIKTFYENIKPDLVNNIEIIIEVIEHGN